MTASPPPLSRRLAAPALALALATALAACAHVGPAVAPNENLRVEGIPPIPASLATEVAAYTEFRPRSLASWHPQRLEMVVSTRAKNTAQLFAVDRAGGTLRQLTDFDEPVRSGGWWPAKPDVLVFGRDAGGNEQSQLFRLDPGAQAPVLLTDANRTHRVIGVNRARDRLLVSSTDVDKTGRRENPTVDISMLDPLDPSSARKIATLPGTGWFAATFSFDDKRIALMRYVSATRIEIWALDPATGARARLLPTAATPEDRAVAYGELSFSRDPDVLFVTTDRDGEFQRAARVDLSTGHHAYFGPENWDVESLDVSPDGRTIATVTNEAGAGVLRLWDAGTLAERPRPQVPIGAVSRLAWHHDSRHLGFNLNSARSPGDVYALDTTTGAVSRWTESKVEGLDPTTFAVQQPIRWTSFDGREISGFIARPPAPATAGPPQGRRAPLGGEASDARSGGGKTFAGRRPVMIQIHGGPEAQARPGFLGRWNYYVNELGVAIIEPNVRGSSGYGKTFISLDDGMKREDSVKDIGALLDWIATQPDLDPTRVVVAGGSYGGYMSLAVAATYPDRIAGAIDVVGIANFVSFLERTESYRRDLRRVEYGDERDPAMREFLTRISPVTNAAKIRKPLFVAHGKNDPRVPYTEAEQIVETVRKNGTPVWYLLAANEGHGFARKENADFYYYATIRFLQDTVLK